jgi:hypothetical protein
MTQFVPIVLTDSGAGSRTFNPLNINYQNGVATWKTNGGSFDNGQSLSFSLSVPTAKSSRCRIKAKVVIPILGVLDQAKVDELICNIEFVVPKNADTDLRNDLLAFSQQLLEEDVIQNAIGSFQGVY